MGAIAVHVEGISKRYRIGRRRPERYPTLRDALASAAMWPLRRAHAAVRPGLGDEAEDEEATVWALRDVSFEIQQGEAVGFVGRNGAGKTTMLKVLSRITKPTRGHADIHGRVGSLLEVGTGFHGELTGRENVYLNGAILGLKKAETKSRFDEIVAFSEVEKFLDTPVKRYSTGMMMRLAFAVAAHLEPEILLVDEVLAVGDVAFQRRCIGKMGEVAREGRTVLFVSHNMALVQALCSRGILLESGRIVADGPISETVDHYLAGLEQVVGQDLLERTDRQGWHEIRLRQVEVSGGADSGAVVAGRPARFVFQLTGVVPGLSCAFTIYDHLGHPVTTLSTAQPGPEDVHERELGPRVECLVDEVLLVPGRYRLDVTVRGRGQVQDGIEAAAFFDVEEGTLRGRPATAGSGLGTIVLPHRWLLPATDA
jgi:lipopolysaccharide transport system ATP-binding protein